MIAASLLAANAASAQEAPAPESAPAGAPAPAGDRVAEADRLFQAGIERMDAGDFAAACPLLEQSQAADPSSGTLLNLGDCYEHLGRTASADDAFAAAVELAKNTRRSDRVQVGELRRARLAPQLRRFRLVLPAQSTPNLSIALDGQPLSPRTALFAIDPGAHALRVSAPGYQDFTAQLEAPDPGFTFDVRIPQLQPVPTSPPQRPDAAPREASSSLDGNTIAALACGAVGVAGVVGGTIFGLQSISKHDESDRYCKGNSCSDPRGVEAMDSARSAGNVSTVSFIVGGLGLGAATLLWFTRPTPRSEGFSAQLGLSPGAVQLRGRF